MAVGLLSAIREVRLKYIGKLLFYAACLLYHESLAYLTTKPQNEAVVVGSNVTLSCVSSSTDRIKWNFTCSACPAHRRRRQTLDADLAETFGIVDRVVDKRHDLVIANVTTNHSGIYTCVDRNGNGQTAFAELTVLRLASHVSLPVCPRDAVVRTGDDVVLQAATRPGNEINWFRSFANADVADTVVYSGTVMDYVAVDDRYNVIKTHGGQVDLVIRDARPDDAGLYRARDEIDRKEASANLVVIDDTESGIYVQHLSASELECRCTIKFRGNLVPSIYWFDAEGKIADARLYSDVDIVRGEKATSSLRVLTEQNSQACPYRCQATFQLSRCNEHFADYTWTSQTTSPKLPDAVIINDKNDAYVEHCEKFYYRVCAAGLILISAGLLTLLLCVSFKLTIARQAIKLAKPEAVTEDDCGYENAIEEKDEYQKIALSTPLQVCDEHPYATVNQ